MRKLLFKFQEVPLEDASSHPGNLSGHLKDLEETGKKLRCTMGDVSVKMLCGFTDEIALRVVNKNGA